MIKFALLGRELSHSFSQKYFTDKFEKADLDGHVYELIELEDKSALLKWINEEALKYKGLNITIPFKQDLLGHIDFLSEEAAEIKAINTISINRGELKGHNTDIYGFEKSLSDLGWIRDTRKALILGTGGASKAVEYVLKKLGINYNLVSRNPNDYQLSYNGLYETGLQDYQMIVNTTPLGTFPNVNEAPDLPYHTLKKNTKLYDLVYNPPITLFLKRGAKYICKTTNGLAMLEGQAEKAWQIWNEHEEE